MRKRRAVKRDVLPDPIYKSKVVAKLINNRLIQTSHRSQKESWGIVTNIVENGWNTKCCKNTN